MKKKKFWFSVIIFAVLLLSLPACGGTAAADTTAGSTEAATTFGSEVAVGSDEWDVTSHGDEAEPDYATVFPQDSVNEIAITISAEEWAAEMADMTDLYGEQGTGSAGPGGERPDGAAVPGQNRAPADAGTPLAGAVPGQGMGQPPEGAVPGGGMDQTPPDGMGAGGDLTMAENPIWITATITFNGQTWENVGFRLKGNSSLARTWSSGDMKFPFRLDFDEFEEDYHEIADQRFYGFEQLSFSSNFNDSSFLHEKVAADIFREAGIASANTAFYAVTVDYGDGPVYMGLFTAVEVIEDTVIKTQFDDASGNVYKPEGAGATFAEGSFAEDSFDKQTNGDEADYSDISAVFDALHSELRTTDAAAWRAQLESVFDVGTFLNWLAVNTAIQNWDTYGVMNHNYYLYTNPATGLVTWIPWDNNEAMSSGGGRQGVVALDMSNVEGEQWPLIGYLLADPVYLEAYQDYLGTVVEGAFAPAKMAETYQRLHDLIALYAAIEIEGSTTLSSLDAFNTSVEALNTHAQERYEAVQAYLAQ